MAYVTPVFPLQQQVQLKRHHATQAAFTGAPGSELAGAVKAVQDGMAILAAIEKQAGPELGVTKSYQSERS